ncbi:CinA family protein [Mangrovicella endophytica]|uniref:CinA family protein n=1 Tax=Mangrovicella endophytica TaxID=2066697 RepID=UPI002477D50E|nr:CinA family protein [Mangrovicella endophytica]
MSAAVTTASSIEAAATEIIAAYTAAGLMIATAESCTGGLVAAALTDVPGSSAVLERGFVTYSNAAKADCLGVDPAVLASAGAVSEIVARQMAEGTLRASQADVAVSITGIAGPGGGSVEKPVGLVHFGCARRGGATVHREERFGDLGRPEIRQAAVAVALGLLRDALEAN